MLRNYYTLYHVARELHEKLAEGYLFEIHSQDRNELTLSFVTPDGEHLQLIVTVRSREFSLSTREGLNRKRRNSAAIMEELYELRVAGVSMSPLDREIIIALEGGHLLVIRFFSADTNVLHIVGNRIVDAFKDARELGGTHWNASPDEDSMFRTLELVAGDRDRFMERFEATGEALPLERRLAAFLPGFDLDLARKLVARARGADDPEALFEALGGLLYDLADPLPAIVEQPGRAPGFSLFGTEEEACRTPYDEVLDALNHYARRMHRFLHLQAGAGTLRKELRQQIDRTSRELDNLLRTAVTETAERCETFGHLLTGAIGKPVPESGKITLPNFYESGSPEVAIPLRRELNMQQNAAWYYSRATKSREKRAASESRRKLLEERLEELRENLDRLEACDTEDELRRLTGKGRSEKKGAVKHARKSDETRVRFRTVPISDRATLYIGRDAANNERLTFGLARPDDIWLHAQGVSGSHCILRGASMQNMTEIRRAAEIAAWNSAARTSGLVPVMYTLKKYVRKVRGATGSVNVEREKVLMVRPLKE
jgi:predicted ribosome quality control (RQC) complex YloA/Tae2 family protein